MPRGRCDFRTSPLARADAPHVQEAPALGTEDALGFPISAGIMLAGLYGALKFLSPVYVNAVVNAYLALATFGAGAVLLAAPTQLACCRGKPVRQYTLPVVGEVSSVHVPGMLLAAAASVAWCVCGHWAANNALAVLLCVAALQQITVGRVRTAFLLLSLLFVYDIVMVFYTPLMVTVAKNINAPIKLMFPASPSSMAGLSWQEGLASMGNASAPLLAGNWSALLAAGHVDSNGSFAEAPVSGGLDTSPAPRRDTSAMLGLGDIVVPGIFVAMMLRFDAFRAGAWKPHHLKADAAQPASTDLLPPAPVSLDFPKPYFWAQMAAYLASLAVTLGVMYVFKHAQPALLYLVPGTMLTAIATALVRGEWQELMAYSEAPGDVDLIVELQSMLNSLLGKQGEQGEQGEQEAAVPAAEGKSQASTGSATAKSGEGSGVRRRRGRVEG